MSEFQRGDMCVCVAQFRGQGGETLPEVSGVYTVRDVASSPYGVGLYLEEIRNTVRNYANAGRIEPHFASQFFRKIRKPDISALRELVADLPRELENT